MQTDRQTDRQTGRQTLRQVDRQTDRQDSTDLASAGGALSTAAVSLLGDDGATRFLQGKAPVPRPSK